MVVCASSCPSRCDVGNADSLPRNGAFHAPSRRESDPFRSGSRTASHPPGPPAKLGQPLHILVCQENRTTTTVRFGRVDRLYHPKACEVPVYRAPAKGKQLGYANAADTNRPHHCTVGFREFVKQTRPLALVQFEETVPVPLRSLRAFA